MAWPHHADVVIVQSSMGGGTLALSLLAAARRRRCASAIICGSDSGLPSRRSEQRELQWDDGQSRTVDGISPPARSFFR